MKASPFFFLAVICSLPALAEPSPEQVEVWQVEDQFVQSQSEQLDHMIGFADAILRNLSHDRPDLGAALEDARAARAKFAAHPQGEPTQDYVPYRVAVFSMTQQFKPLVEALIRKRTEGTFDPLPEDLKAAYLNFKKFDDDFTPRFDPLNARMLKAQSEGYTSRWGLW